MPQEQRNVRSHERYYHYVHPTDYVFAGHRHRDYELNIILSGEMEVTCNENVCRLQARDAILIPPYVFHRNRVISEDTAEMVVVQFIADTPMEEEVRTMRFGTREQVLLDLFMKDTEENCVLHNGCYLTRSITADKLFDVLLAYTDGTGSPVCPSEDGQQKIYRHAVRYMLEHVDLPLQMADIARECKVCRTTLKKVFAHYTGRGCIEFFGELKLDRAKHLLAEGMSCGEVARTLCYSSQAYFSRKFKDHYGFLPSSVK